MAGLGTKLDHCVIHISDWKRSNAFYRENLRRGQMGLSVAFDLAMTPTQAVLVARAEAKLGVTLGHTTADERVTLEPIYCLGLCATAPSAMLDGRVVGRLDEARIDALVAEAQR